MLKIHKIVLGPIQTNCYIIRRDDSQKCLIIDPGYEPNTILDYVNQKNLTVEAILLTHGHFDHVGGVGDIAAETDCRIFLCPEDLAMPQAMTAGKLLYTDTYEDGDELNLAGIRISVIHTPGHTPGSVCLKIGNVLFSGDTLFQGCCGRTDFPCGNQEQIEHSLRRLAQIPENCIVYPGHGPETTLDSERQYNPYM